MENNDEKQMISNGREVMRKRCDIHILLVDDEQGYLDVLTNRLARRSIFATKAAGGSDAIRILRNQDFDVMVLDLKMGDMNGIEVLKIVKKMVPELPVIILTGHGSQSASEEGMACGAFDYLSKPCDLKELMEKIHEAYDSTQSNETEVE